MNLEWLQHFNKHSTKISLGAKRLLILDGHGPHHTKQSIQNCDNNGIIPFGLPRHLTHLLQPLDVVVFQSLRHYQAKALTSWYEMAYIRFSEDVDLAHSIPGPTKNLYVDYLHITGTVNQMQVSQQSAHANVQLGWRAANKQDKTGSYHSWRVIVLATRPIATKSVASFSSWILCSAPFPSSGAFSRKNILENSRALMSRFVNPSSSFISTRPARISAASKRSRGSMS